MANKKPQNDQNIRVDLRDKGSEQVDQEQQMKILSDIYGQNAALLAVLKDVSKKIENFSDLDSAIKDSNKKLFSAIKNNDVEGIKKLSKELMKNYSKNSSSKQTKDALFEANNPEISKKLNSLKISIDSKDNKSLKELKTRIDEIREAAINGSYSVRSMLEEFDVESFNSLDNASDQLKMLYKEADKAGVSISTLGLKFKATGNHFNIFNKNAKDGYNYVKNLRDGFDKCGAKTFAFYASLAILNKGFKDVSGNLTKLMDETVSFRRNFQILSNSSKDMLPGGAKQLNDIRTNMKLSREETVKFAQIAQELRGTTYSVTDLTRAMQGMKDTIGEVDIEKLKSLSNIMKNIPKVQLDAFTSGIGNEDDVMNAIMNMQRSGNVQEVLNLGASGALGSNFAKASGTNISDNDKAYVGMKRNMGFAKERIGEVSTNVFGSAFSALPLLAGSSALGDMGKKLFAGVGSFLGGKKAFSDILGKDKEISETEDVAKNTKSIAESVKAIKDKINEVGFGSNIVSGASNDGVIEDIIDNVIDGASSKTGKSSRLGKGVTTKIGKSSKGIVTGVDSLSKSTKGIKGIKGLGSLTKGITSVASKAFAPIMKTASLGLKTATKFLGPVGIAATVALTAVEGIMNIEKDNAKAKSMQNELGVSGSTNAYSFSGLLTGAFGGKVSTDPNLLVNSLDSFVQGALESLSFGLYKESRERKENRQLDIAARTQSKYSVQGFKELYKLNKKVNALKEANIKRNIYAAQHYDATVKRLDAITQGQFSMLETLKTQVSLLKMSNAYAMNISNEQYSLNADKAINNALTGFAKEQTQIDNTKQEVLTNLSLNETERSAELSKAAEAEINVRLKLLNNLKKALNLDTIPEIIENGFLMMINDAVRNVNSIGYSGSNNQVLDTMFSDINLSFRNLSLSIEESSKSLRRLKHAQSQMADVSRERMDRLEIDIGRKSISKLLGAIPKESDLSVTGTWDGSYLTSFDLFGSNDAFKNLTEQERKLYEKAGIKFNDGFAWSDLGKNAAKYGWNGPGQAVLGVDYLQGGYDHGTLQGTFTETGKNNLIKTFRNAYEEAVKKKDRAGMDMALKHLNSIAKALTSDGRKGLSEQQMKMIEDLNNAHNSYAGLINGKNFDYLYKTESGADFSKKSYSLKEDDFIKLMSQDKEFEKNLKARGLVKKDGSLDMSKQEEISQEYTKRQNEVAKTNSLKELQKTETFKNAIEKWEKSTGKKYDVGNADAVSGVLEQYSESLVNKDIAGITKAQQEAAYNSVEEANNLNDKESLDNLKSNKDVLSKLFEEGLKNADGTSKEVLQGGLEALKKLTSGKKLSQEETIELENRLKQSTDTLKMVNNGMKAEEIALYAHVQALNDIGNQQLKTLEAQTQVIKQLSLKYTDLIGKITSLEQVIQKSTAVRIKELTAAKAKTDLTLTEWRGGNTGSASFDVFRKQNEAEYAKMDVIDSTLDRLNSGELEKNINEIMANGSNAFNEIIGNLTSGGIDIGNGKTISDAIREMGKLAADNANETDFTKQQKALEEMDSLEKSIISKLEEEYQNKRITKDEYQAQLNSIKQVRMTSGAVVGSKGTIEGVKISLEKQRNEAEIKLIANLKEQSDVLKKTKESLIAFAKSAERYALDQRSALLKENLGSGDDIKNNVEASMEAIERQFAESKRMQQTELKEMAKQLSEAENNYENNPTKENRDKVIQMQALYNTSVGKGSSLELERMEAAAKAMRAGLEAITNKFALATEAIDILRDRAENVAGTTEEWFKLENERLSLMNQEVQEMKNLIASEKFRNLSEAEQQRLRNDLARKQLNFEKEKIGAQRNVFEKQLGAIVGGLQQSGAFRGMSKAAIFGAGHGINEADMAVQNRSRKVVGYTDRLALANNFSGDNIPVDRMAPHGDIDAAADAHNQITGQSDREYYNRKVGGLLDNVGISGSKSKEIVQNIESEIEKLEQQFNSGSITKEEKDKKVSELNSAKEMIKVSDKVSKLSNDEVFKSILTYVIDIDELLRTGKIELTNGQQSFDKNGSNKKASSDDTQKKVVRQTSGQVIKANNNSGENLIFKVGTSEGDLAFNERMLKNIETQRREAENGLRRVSDLLTRRGLSSSDKEKYLKLMNKYEKYLHESSVSNSESVAQLRKQIKIGKELQEISKYEKIINNDDGKYNSREISSALRKLTSFMAGMSGDAKVEYINSKEETIEKYRGRLRTLDKNSDDYKFIERRIGREKRYSDELFSSLEGDDLMKAVIQRAQRLNRKKEEIDNLSKGTVVDRAIARKKQTEYDNDNSSFERILKKKGISRDSINNAMTKHSNLSKVNKKIEEINFSIDSIKSRSRSRSNEDLKEMDDLNSENIKLMNQKNNYNNQLNNMSGEKEKNSKARTEISKKIDGVQKQASEKWDEYLKSLEEASAAEARMKESRGFFGGYDQNLKEEYEKKQKRAMINLAQYNDLISQRNLLMKDRAKIGASDLEQRNIEKGYERDNLGTAITELDQKISWEKDPDKKKKLIEQKRKYKLRRDRLTYELETPLEKQIEDNKNEQNFTESLINENKDNISYYEREIKRLEDSIASRNSRGVSNDFIQTVNEEEQRQIDDFKNRLSNAQAGLSLNTGRMGKLKQTEQQLLSDKKAADEAKNNTPEAIKKRMAEIDAKIAANNERKEQLQQEVEMSSEPTREERHELEDLEYKLGLLNDEKSRLEKIKDYGITSAQKPEVVGAPEEKKVEPPSSIVRAQMDRRSAQNQAILNSKEALEMSALSGGNSNAHTAINTAGIDGSKAVDTFGRYQDSGGGSSGSQKIEVILKIDERVLAKQVVDIMKGSYNRVLQHSVNGGLASRATNANT